jgi:uncharacterized repeat protein (TIGR01451 family)
MIKPLEAAYRVIGRAFLALVLAISYGSMPATTGAAQTAPSVVTSHRSVFVSDANGNRLADYGDVVGVTLIITNIGRSLLGLQTYMPVNTDAVSNLSATLLTDTVRGGPGLITQTIFGSFRSFHPGLAIESGPLATGGVLSMSYRLRINSAIAAQIEHLSYFAGISEVQSQLGGSIAYVGPVTNTDPITIPLAPRSELAIASQLAAFQAKNGESTLIFSYANTGKQTATGISITHALPPGVAYVAERSSANWRCLAATCVAQIGALAPRDPNGISQYDALTLTLRATADFPAAATAITSSVQITSDGSVADADLTNNTYELRVPLGIPAAVTAQKTYRLIGDANQNGKIESGDLLEFMIALTNTSATRQLVDALIFDRLSDYDYGRLQFLPGGTTSHGRFQSYDTIVLERLLPGEHMTVTLRATVLTLPPRDGPHGGLVNHVLLRDPYAEVMSQYQGAELTRVIVPVFYARDVALSKSVQTSGVDQVVDIGERVTFTIQITNTGIEPLSNWVLRDGSQQIGPGNNYSAWCMVFDTASVSTTLGAVSFVPTGYADEPTIQVALGALQPGQFGTVQLNATIGNTGRNCFGLDPFNSAGVVDVSGSENIPIRFSNAARMRLHGPRTAIARTSAQTQYGNTGVVAGEVVTYTVAITNVGTAAIDNVWLFDSTYSCLTIEPGSITSTHGSTGLVVGSPPALTGNLGTLAIGASARVRFRATVNGGPRCSTATNSATFSAAIVDPATGQSNLTSLVTTNQTAHRIVSAQPSPMPAPTQPSPARKIHLPLIRRTG